jgi:ABC-2 type transport system permease protein
MKAGVIGALLKKDLALFMANRFYMLITIIGMIFYIVIYFVLPSSIDETLHLGMYAPTVPPAFGQLTEQPGVDIEMFDSAEELKSAVSDGTYSAGIVLPADIMDTWAAGGKPQVIIYYSAESQAEVQDAISTLVTELSYAQTGQALNIETEAEVLGPDMLGSQIALAARMRPLLAVFILIVEVMSLAALISVEIDQGTAQALSVTPMRTADLFIAKGAMGVGMALAQAVFFMAIVGGFAHQPLIILVTLFLGSVMVVGLGFLLAALSRDVTVVTGWGVLLMIIMAIPGFGSVIPGLLSDWTRIIPSFYLTDTISRVMNFGAGWADIWSNLAILSAFTLAVILLGMVTLRRRYQ